MYREKIREYYDHLSRSYRKVADYIMSNYYEVSFMTAAQLAYAVGVDTTTVVRFSQRVGYNGYPELLNDIRDQVKAEIYAAYTPKELSPTECQINYVRGLQGRYPVATGPVGFPGQTGDKLPGYSAVGPTVPSVYLKPSTSGITPKAERPAEGAKPEGNTGGRP